MVTLLIFIQIQKSVKYCLQSSIWHLTNVFTNTSSSYHKMEILVTWYLLMTKQLSHVTMLIFFVFWSGKMITQQEFHLELGVVW